MPQQIDRIDENHICLRFSRVVAMEILMGSGGHWYVPGCEPIASISADYKKYYKLPEEAMRKVVAYIAGGGGGVSARMEEWA